MLIHFNFSINELFFHLVFSLISFILLKLVIFIIDQYADNFLLTMLSDLKVKITIVTSTSSYSNKEIIPNNITIIHNDIIHDKFIIIDDLVYAIGSSFNDIGKKSFFMMKLENITKDMILKEKKGLIRYCIKPIVLQCEK